MSGIVALKRMRRVLLLVGLVFAGLPVGSAFADTTIGHLGGNTGAGLSIVAADPNYVVPSGGGRITAFSFQAGSQNAGEQVDFLVLRQTGGLNAYTVIGKTGLVTLTGTQTGATVETFPANIPVQGGEVLGLWFPGFLDDAAELGDGGGTVFFSSGQPDPNVGDVTSLQSEVGPPAELNESANLAPPLPNSKDQCMHDGWKSFGGTFKNQGDCVKFRGDSRKELAQRLASDCLNSEAAEEAPPPGGPLTLSSARARTARLVG